ncbi:hypothetical protein Tco_0739273 [Tanacetum coccineum]
MFSAVGIEDGLDGQNADIKTVTRELGFFDMHMPNVAWYLKVGGASFRDDGVREILRGSPIKGTYGSSSSHMISMNITSPSSSLVQTNFILGDWGTNPSDSSIEFNFRTCSVAMEANGSGYGCGLELMFPRLLSSGSLTWDSSGCFGWIVMALIERYGRGLRIAGLELGKNEQMKLDESLVLGS